MAKKKTQATLPNEEVFSGEAPEAVEETPSKQLVEFIDEIPGAAEVSKALHELLRQTGAHAATAGMEFIPYSELSSTVMPWENFGFEFLTQYRGIPTQRVMELIGEEHVGKTTTLFLSAKPWLVRGCPVLYIETENKPILYDRVLRIFGPDVRAAKDMVSRITFIRATTLMRMLSEIVVWIRGVRRLYPKSVPALVIVDTFSKLMTDAEEQAISFAAASEADKKKAAKKVAKKAAKKAASKGKAKKGSAAEAGTAEDIVLREKDDSVPIDEDVFKIPGLGAAHNLGHAQFAMKFSRALPYLTSTFNMSLYIASHQNAYIDMNAKPGTPPKPKYRNKTKIGGKALDQITVVQIIMVGDEYVRHESSGVVYGRNIVLTIDKNGLGANGRQFKWILKTDRFQDDPDANYMEPTIDSDDALARVLVDKSFLGTTVAKGYYSCPALACVGVRAKKLAEAFRTHDKYGAFMKTLGVKGY